MRIVKESKRREVLQLLKDYRSWHSAFGGSLPADEGHLKNADYGPGGYIESGAEFDAEDISRLSESFAALENALTILRGEDFSLWLGLHSPYLNDPADPEIVSEWRRKSKGEFAFVSKRMLIRHDAAVEMLSEMLANEHLYVVFPKRMSSMKEKQIERRNDELWSLYETFRYSDGMSRNKAVEKASEHCGYVRSRGYEIVDGREGRKAS